MFKPLSVFNRNNNQPVVRSGAGADPFFTFHREMNRLFDDFFGDFGQPSLLAAGDGHRPIHVDYRETGAALEIDAELPGVEEADIDVEINDNILTIRAEKQFQKDEEKNGGRRSTRAYSSFQRTLALPFDVNADDAEATFRNGVLHLKLPKPPEVAARSKKIAVKRA